jgi:hypothetical protein
MSAGGELKKATSPARAPHVRLATVWGPAPAGPCAVTTADGSRFVPTVCRCCLAHLVHCSALAAARSTAG